MFDSRLPFSDIMWSEHSKRHFTQPAENALYMVPLDLISWRKLATRVASVRLASCHNQAFKLIFEAALAQIVREHDSFVAVL